MKSICIYFQLHLPLRLKRYRFFEIGTDHYYYNDFSVEDTVRFYADNCFLPANKTIQEIIRNTKGKFKIAYSISGVLLEQLEQYAPEVIDSFRELADTGSVEFLSETYAHSLAGMYDENEFKSQLQQHADKIESLFGQRPKVLCNSELIYSDEIGELAAKVGLKGALIEGAKQVMGWKSCNYIYKHPYADLKLLPRNYGMSDNISFKFSNRNWDQFPLTADKYIEWIATTPAEEKYVTIGMNYVAIGIQNKAESGIFDFIKAIPYHAMMNKITFMTPSEIIEKEESADIISSTEPVSWADEEKDVSAWNGNELQGEALNKLYAVGERVRLCTDKAIKYDWLNLQASDNFYFMSTKHFAGNSEAHTGNYESPYEAFMNYMNILSDFLQRVDEQYPTSIENEELNSLLKTINNQEATIVELENKIAELQKSSYKKSLVENKKERKTTEKKTTTKKAVVSKATKK